MKITKEWAKMLKVYRINFVVFSLTLLPYKSMFCTLDLTFTIMDFILEEIRTGNRQFCIVVYHSCMQTQHRRPELRYPSHNAKQFVLYCAPLYCIAYSYIVLCCIVLHCIVLNCAALNCIVLHCIVLYCIYCIVLLYRIVVLF